MLLIVPAISGYVGADTIGCVLSTRMYEAEETVLMIDIGTNGPRRLSSPASSSAAAASISPEPQMPAAFPPPITLHWMPPSSSQTIGKVLLAGAFGSYLRPESACRIGLLPPVLLGKISVAGNAAGGGAKMV